jgi:hypothetical protein
MALRRSRRRKAEEAAERTREEDRPGRSGQEVDPREGLVTEALVPPQGGGTDPEPGTDPNAEYPHGAIPGADPEPGTDPIPGTDPNAEHLHGTIPGADPEPGTEPHGGGTVHGPGTDPNADRLQGTDSQPMDPDADEYPEMVDPATNLVGLTPEDNLVGAMDEATAPVTDSLELDVSLEMDLADWALEPYSDEDLDDDLPDDGG